MDRNTLLNPRRPLVAAVASLLLLAGPALVASAKDAEWLERLERGRSQNLVQVLEADGRFTLLLTAVGEAGLTEALATAPLTLFAPTDDAFLALGEETIQALLNDIPTLTEILEYHLVGGKRLASSLAREISVETLQGGSVFVQRQRRDYFVNGVPIVERSVRASNGFVQVIEEVLDPADGADPVESVVDVLARDGRFGILIAAVTQAGLVETLETAESLTVFAPTDEAFLALGQETIDALLGDIPTLQNILLYHVLLERKSAFDLIISGTATTAQGAAVRIRLAGWRDLFVDESRVVDRNLHAPNGAIHVLDSVLIPPAEGTGVLDVLNAEGYTTLATVIEAAGLAEALAGLGPVTIFAPTNEAFAALGQETIDALLADIPTLQRILLYHVVPEQKSLLDVILERRLTTAEGSEVRSFWFFGPVYVGPHKVIEPNLTAPDATVHGIDGVLLPPGL